MAGVAAENSYGLLQFNDRRASGGNFTGGPYSIPIYMSGIQTDWKEYFKAATTDAELKTLITNLSDWRADPYASIVNFIRSTDTYYAQLMGTLYEPNVDFRVDLVAPARANGSGSQRDCFELFGVAHRLPSDAFGGTYLGVTYDGGLTTTGVSPYQWHITGENPVNNLPYMTVDGTNRANLMRGCYPAGGYSYP